MIENIENSNPPHEAVQIKDHFKLVINTHYYGVAHRTINAKNIELNPSLIKMVRHNKFGRAATTDPHLHPGTFLEIRDMVKINNVSNDIIRLRLFSFSLRDYTRIWLQSLPLGSLPHGKTW